MQTKSTELERVFVVRDAVLSYLRTKHPDGNVSKHPLFKAVREWFMEQMDSPEPPAA